MVELWDEFEHAEKNLVYSAVNLPGPGYREEEFQPILNCCDCTTDCSTSCSHLVQYGKNYSMGLMLKSSVNQPIFECNARCSCDPSRCYNRVVQFGPNPNLKIIQTESKGFGVICKTKLRSGEYVCEYAGEIIDEKTARIRFSADADASNYILVLKEFGGAEIVSTTIIDPTAIGNIGRYLNHSCRPNLEMVPVRIDSAVPHLALFASKDIIQGEELCFDYGDTIRSGKQGLVEPGVELDKQDLTQQGGENLLITKPVARNQSSSGSDTNLSDSCAGTSSLIKPGFVKPVLKVPRVPVLDKPGARKLHPEKTKKDVSSVEILIKKPVSPNIETENSKSVIEEASAAEDAEESTYLYKRSKCLCNAKNCKKWLPFNRELFL